MPSGGGRLHLSNPERYEEEQIDIQAPRSERPPSLRMELASYVHWHTAYQMSINSIALRGLVNPVKYVELFRLADGNGGSRDYDQAQGGPPLPMAGNVSKQRRELEGILLQWQGL